MNNVIHPQRTIAKFTNFKPSPSLTLRLKNFISYRHLIINTWVCISFPVQVHNPGPSIARMRSCEIVIGEMSEIISRVGSFSLKSWPRLINIKAVSLTQSVFLGCGAAHPISISKRNFGANNPIKMTAMITLVGIDDGFRSLNRLLSELLHFFESRATRGVVSVEFNTVLWMGYSIKFETF